MSAASLPEQSPLFPRLSGMLGSLLEGDITLLGWPIDAFAEQQIRHRQELNPWVARSPRGLVVVDCGQALVSYTNWSRRACNCAVVDCGQTLVSYTGPRHNPLESWWFCPPD